MNVLSRRLIAASAIAAALALGACASDPAPGAVAEARTPTEQFPIDVVPAPEEIRLAVHAQGLSPTQADATADFVDGWRDAQGGRITIQAPSGVRDPAAVHRTAEGARGFLQAQGVPVELVRIVGYDAHGQADAPLIVGYERLEARGPVCGEAWGGLTHTNSNEPQSNFGCAITANIAAQIADPHDLLRPRRSDPADAQRRGVVLGKYRNGETTAAAIDQQASGVVSKAVN